MPHRRTVGGVPLPALPPAALQRLQPQQPLRKPSFMADQPQATSEPETPRRLISSKSLTDIGSAMKGVVLTDSGAALPTPLPARANSDNTRAIAALSGIIASSSQQDVTSRGSLDLPRVQTQPLAERPQSSLGRKKSILQSMRPSILQSATTSVIPRVRSSMDKRESGEGSSAASSSSGGSSAPAPVWNLDDEENLPSPFAKRNVDFGVYGRAAGTVLPLNTATALKPSGSAAVKSRPSLISRALKASGDAQRALARRQVEGKAGVS